jgi:hypothetical protein
MHAALCYVMLYHVHSASRKIDLVYLSVCHGLMPSSTNSMSEHFPDYPESSWPYSL